MVIHIKGCEALPLDILLPFPPKSYRPHDLKEGPCDYIASWEQMRSCFSSCLGPPGLSLDREQSWELIVVKNEHSVHMPYSWVQSAALSHPLDSENSLCAGLPMGCCRAGNAEDFLEDSELPAGAREQGWTHTGWFLEKLLSGHLRSWASC